MSISMNEFLICRENAKNTLDKFHELEKNLCKYTLKFPNGAIISCKSEERLEEYKKLFNVK